MRSSADIQHCNSMMRYDTNFLSKMDIRIFDPAWLRTKDLHQGTSRGRSHAHFFELSGQEMVLRHFRRGGLMGKLNSRFYRRVSKAQSRSFREFELLQWMQSVNLPVPRPIAALTTFHGPVYQAAIITERIATGRPFDEALQAGAVSRPVWNKIGKAISKLHAAGVFHADLNCRNILLDQKDHVFFIDFDKCDRRKPGPWKARNLDRLKRSLEKERRKQKGVEWHDDDWLRLISVYEEQNGS